MAKLIKRPNAVEEEVKATGANSVGNKIESFLTEGQFQTINGPEWVLCDGRDVTGSLYHTVTGDTSIPNHVGLPARMTGVQAVNGRNKTGPALGQNQEDAFQGHWHNIQVGTDLSGLNLSPNWTPGYNNMINGPYNLNNGPRAATSDGVNGTPRTAAETRMSAIGVNVFIKIN